MQFPNHGGLTATVLGVVSLVAEQRSILTARGRFCTPRRANARRSCERAIVHRECCYFSEDRRRTPRAAVGVRRALFRSLGTCLGSQHLCSRWFCNVRRTLFCLLEVLVLAEVNRPLAGSGTVLTNVLTCKLNSAHVMADSFCWRHGVNKCLHL